MHTLDDKPNGVWLNHNGDWSGEVRIGWDVNAESKAFAECWVNGPDLVAGSFTPTRGNADPPVNVLTRAVALAVEGFLRSKMERALDNLFIRRGKL